ncbi:MAG: site-2 protease family protein [Sorangium cellulosum]|nr:MAG: site-2 protease family protein [Sorangium cellulosum]
MPSSQSPRPKQRRAVPPYVTNLFLFIVTVVSVFTAGNPGLFLGDKPPSISDFWAGWPFAIPLMIILLAHEFGHYIAAQIHGVPASLPYFIPLPMLSPFGTMGAIIAMKGRIKSRRALLDIGASGPLAGMLFAVPILIWGLSQSEVHVVVGHGWLGLNGLLEGQCLLYSLLKWLVVGPIPQGGDVYLHPTAFAGWTGLLITMVNLVPVGQLDGGHVAYALFGPRQNAIARLVHFSLPLVGTIIFAINSLSMPWGKAAEMSLFWLVWFGFLFVLRRFSGGNHPPTEPGDLGLGRKFVAIFTLILFVLLFMPTPMSVQ